MEIEYFIKGIVLDNIYLSRVIFWIIVAGILWIFYLILIKDTMKIYLKDKAERDKKTKQKKAFNKKVKDLEKDGKKITQII